MCNWQVGVFFSLLNGSLLHGVLPQSPGPRGLHVAGPTSGGRGDVADPTLETGYLCPPPTSNL